MDFLPLTLRQHPCGCVVCEEPVRRKLGGESKGLGFSLIQKAGPQPVRSFGSEGGFELHDLDPGRPFDRPSWIVGEDLGLDGGWNVDTASVPKEREDPSFAEMEQGTCVADDPHQRSASLRLRAQRMSSR